MNKAEILGLAARIEALEGADREVDAEIAHATCWRWEGWEEGDLRIEDRDLAYVIQRAQNGFNSIWRNMPRFTSSLDAAMGLVPDGFSWESGQTTDGGHATVSKMPVDDDAYSGGRLPVPNIQTSAYAATPALALTAAALRAIASTMEDDRG